MTKPRRLLKDFISTIFSSKNSKKSPKSKTLRLEALEDRTLLNVGPVDFDESLCQQAYYSQMTVTQPEDHSVLTVDMPTDMGLTPMEANQLNRPNFKEVKSTGPNSIRITLTYRENAGSYKVQYSTDGGTTWSSAVVVNQTTGSDPVYRFQGLKAETTYWFRARSIIKSGDTAHTNSDWTDVKSATTDPKLSPGTVNISVSERTSSSIKVSWNALSDIEFYNVKIATSEAGLENATVTKVSGATNYTFTGLSSNTQYWIQVRAFPNNRDTYALATTIRTAKTLTVLSKPTNIQATADSIGKAATISFKDGSITGVETGAITYEVQWKLSTESLWSNSTQTTKKFTSAGEHSFQISGLVATNKYNVRIRVQSPNSSYENSGWVYVDTPIIKMKSPTLTELTDKTTKNSVTLSISECTQATHYKVFYITEEGLNNGDDWSHVIFTQAQRTSAKVEGLAAGTKYIFRARAHNADVVASESAPSEWIYVTTKGGAAKIQNLTCTQPSFGKVKLAWSHTDSDSIAGVRLLSRCEGHQDWTTLCEAYEDVSSFTIPDVVTGEWQYMVQLINANGNVLTSQTVAISVNSPCSETEVAKLKAFFNQYTYENDDNAIQYDLKNDQNPSWWTGILWTAGTDNLMHVRQIDWEGMTLVGALDCSGMAYLEKVFMGDLLIHEDNEGNEYGLTSLNFSGCSKLNSLICTDSYVESVNLQGCTALDQLILSYLELSSIDVSSCPNLRYLNLNANSLSGIDLSHNTKLTMLFLGNNQFQTIDLSHNTNLTGLAVNDNNLAALDFSKLVKLEQLYTWDSGLEILDLLKNTKLKKLGCLDDTLQYVWYPGPAKREGDLKIVFYGYEYAYDDENDDNPRDHKWYMIPKVTTDPTETIVVPASICESDDDYEWTVPRRNFTLVSDDEDETCCVRFSVTKTIEDYDPAAVAAMLDYFAQTDENGVTNEEKIADLGFRADDPSTWTGVTWTQQGDDEEAPYQLEKISLVDMELEGDLNLSECQALEYVNCETNGEVILAAGASAAIQNNSPLAYALTAQQSDWNDETIPVNPEGNQAPVQVNAWDGTVFLEIWSQFLSHNQVSISWDANLATLSEDSISSSFGVELSGDLAVEDGIATLTLNLDANSSFTANNANVLLGKIVFYLTSQVRADGYRAIPFTVTSGDEPVATLTAEVKGVVYDMNNDKKIDFKDFAQFAKNIGSGNGVGDFNSDNNVGTDDIALFARNYGLTQDSASDLYFDENYTPVLDNSEIIPENDDSEPIALPASGATLEMIEDPVALETGSVWTVTNLNGSSSDSGSFLYALSKAQEGDTIQFDSSLKGKTLNFNSLLYLNKTITINGNGVIFDGQKQYQGFNVNNNHSSDYVTFRNIVFQNFYSANSSCVVSATYGNLKFDNCTFQNNIVGYDAIVGCWRNIQVLNCTFQNNTGGSLYMKNGNQVITNSKFLNNSGFALISWGGNLKATNCTFQKNVSGSSAVHVNSLAEIRNCTFTENYSGNSHGGAIGINHYANPNTVIANCQFVNNSCVNSNGSYGGAICSQSPGLSIEYCTFIGNTAGTQYKNGGVSGVGGAIYARYVSLDHVFMKDNKATSGGGLYLCEGVGTLNYCTITKNYALVYGGGINASTTLKIYNSIIDGNACDFIGSGHGSGVEVGLQHNILESVTVNNSIVPLNAAWLTAVNKTYLWNWAAKSSLLTNEKPSLLNENGYPLPGSAAIQNGKVTMGYVNTVATSGNALSVTAKGKRLLIKTGGQNYKITVNGIRKAISRGKVKVSQANRTYTVSLQNKSNNTVVAQQTIRVLRAPAVRINMGWHYFDCVLGKLDSQATGLLITYGSKTIYWDFATDNRVGFSVDINGKTCTFHYTVDRGINNLRVYYNSDSGLPAKKITIQQVISDGSSLISISNKTTRRIKIRNRR